MYRIQATYLYLIFTVGSHIFLIVKLVGKKNMNLSLKQLFNLCLILTITMYLYLIVTLGTHPKLNLQQVPIPMLHLHEVLHPNLHLLSGAWNVMEGEELPHCTQQHVVEGT